MRVTQQFLDGTDVLPTLQQVRCKRMPQRVRGDLLGDLRTPCRPLDRGAQRPLVKVMPAPNAAAGIGRLMV